MASIGYPNKLSISGPWFFEAKNLTELDELITSCIKDMQLRRDESVTLQVAQEKEKLGESVQQLYPNQGDLEEKIATSYPWNIKTRSVVVYLPGGRTAAGESFKDLMTLPHLHKEVPRGFAAKAVVANTRIELKLQSWGSRDLDIEVFSSDDRFEQELLGKFQNWVSDIQPKRLLQLWLDNSFIFTVLIFFCCLVLPTVIGIISAPEEGANPVRQQAWEMAKSGVNTLNEAKAIQIILSLESGYEPTPVHRERHYPGVRFWSWVLIVYLVLFAMRKPPQGAIGLWGGKRVLKKQRLWLRTISISVPSLIGTSLILPMVLNLLGLGK
jgi:hypothetical protein